MHYLIAIGIYFAFCVLCTLAFLIIVGRSNTFYDLYDKDSINDNQK